MTGACIRVWISIALVLLVFAGNALAEGRDQRTRDGRTIVWNSAPKPDDAASWSGKRDPQRYATGNGTVTWYRMEKKYGTGIRVPVENFVPVIRYSGNMVRGKLDGPVEATDSKGKVFHATFTEGLRNENWMEGPLDKSAPAAAANTGTPAPSPAAVAAKSPSPAPEHSA